MRGRARSDALGLPDEKHVEDRIVEMTEEDANCLIPAGWILLTGPGCGGSG
jgi:hypothetical protein